MGKDEIILERKSHKNNTNFLFLGLYLLILTFFILLVSISSLRKREANKSCIVFRPPLKHCYHPDGIDPSRKMTGASSPAKSFRNMLPISCDKPANRKAEWRGPGGR